MKYSSELMHTLILTDNEYLALHNAIKFYLSDEIQKVGILGLLKNCKAF